MKVRLCIALLLCAMLTAAWAADIPLVSSDWPQYRGPNRDSISPETNLALDWNVQPPRVMWTAEVGDGLSSVVVVKNRAFTMGWSSLHGGEDTIWCFNAESGALLWKYTYPDYQLLSHGHVLPEPQTLRGPMATPCVDGDRIYTSSSSGKVYCLRTDSGEVLWQRNLKIDTGSDRNNVCAGREGSDINVASPLVIGDLVIFGIGATGVGVDKLTGKIRWGWTGGGETVASPIRIPLDGVDYVGVVDSQKAIHLINATNGKELRKMFYPPGRYAPDPIFINGNLLLNYEFHSITTGKTIWTTTAEGLFPPAIVSNGFVYIENSGGPLCCIDLKDGSNKSSGQVPNYSTYIMAQGKLLMLDERGAISVVSVSPEAITQDYKMQLPGPNQGYYVLPSISDGRLFVRGQIGKVTVYDIRGPGHPRFNAHRTDARTMPSEIPANAPPLPTKPTAQDWTQWRGPQRDGVAPATAQPLDWTHGQPRQLWQTNVGPAFSGLISTADRIYTMGFSYQNCFYYGGSGTGWASVSCLDSRSGHIIWEKNYWVQRNFGFVTPNLPLPVYGNFFFWNFSLFYFGCHATPTLDGDQLYTLDQCGNAMCWSAVDGKLIWQKKLVDMLELERPNFYFSGSPLVMDKVVVMAAGTAGVALDKKTGNVVWSTGQEACGCASPVLFTHGGQQQLALFGKDKLYTLAADSGKVQWNYNWIDGYGRNMSDAVPVGDDQLLVCGAGKGAALLQVGTDKPLWEQKSLDPLMMGAPVMLNGYLYGPSQSKNGVVCLDAQTGAEKWASEPMPAMSVTLSGETLVIQCRNGEIHLAKASPLGYTALGKCHPLQSENCFTPPIIAHDKLLCRSWEGDIVALDLATLDTISTPIIVPLNAARMTTLVAQLGAPTLAQRQLAIDGLAQAHGEELARLLPVLLATIKDGSWFAQDAAAQVVQRIGANAIPLAANLTQLANANITTHDWAMVVLLLQTLQQVDPASLAAISPAIQAAMSDADKDVRIAAMQLVDRVPLTDGLIDALFTQAKIPDNYFYMGSVIRRIGREGPAISEKLLPRFLPSLQQIGKPGMLDWSTTLFVLRDIGPGARKALPDLLAFSKIDNWKPWDVMWAKIYADEALRCIKLLENSKEDPLEKYAFINVPPSVKDMQLTCAQGKSVTARLDCTDPDDFERSLLITFLTQPAHGKVSVTKDLNIEYQADLAYAGKDTFTWKAADPTSESGPATVTIEVTGGGAVGAK